MHRRLFQRVILASAWCAAAPNAFALGLDDITNGDAAAGLKAALKQGAVAAVASLGRLDGFLGNDRVRIQLPDSLRDVVQLLRTLGQGAQIDDLVTAMNRGAEAAVPLAKGLLSNAVQSMTVDDAKAILSGSETSVTQFFDRQTRPALRQQFLPIITRATQRVGLTDKYNQLAGRASELGLIKPEDATIEHHVNERALDGLFFMIGEEEKNIRQNPAAYGSALLTRVFGLIR